MDHSIDAHKWIIAAEEEICDIDGALCALGTNQQRKALKYTT